MESVKKVCVKFRKLMNLNGLCFLANIGEELINYVLRVLENGRRTGSELSKKFAKLKTWSS